VAASAAASAAALEAALAAASPKQEEMPTPAPNHLRKSELCFDWDSGTAPSALAVPTVGCR
jgi:hypothetical protein